MSESELEKVEAEAEADLDKAEAEAKALEEKTKEELLKLAKEAELEGRSTMNKGELVDALSNDSDSEGDGSVSEGGTEVRDAGDLLTATGPGTENNQQSAEEKISKGNPVPGDEPTNTASTGAQERQDEVNEDNPVEGKLAQSELDFQGPLHLQAPEERIMTGAVSEEHAEEQKKLLENKPEDHVGNVTEAGFPDKSNPEAEDSSSEDDGA